MTILAIGVLGFASGVWVLLHPASIFVRPWRAQQAEAAVQGVLLGPYPVEKDFIALKRRGVTTIISLLEPAVPYEKILLEKEQALAARYGMQVRNFPMGSILGQKFGAGYSDNARAAAEAARNAVGKAYIHCYLGLHRAKNVQRYLEQVAGVQAKTYAAVNATSDADLAAERKAKQLFHAGKYPQSLAVLEQISRKTPRVLRVRGWNQYRLRQFDQARASFEASLALAPGDHDSRVGLAYCDLNQGRLQAAEAAFTALHAQRPQDGSALEGLAYAHYRQAHWSAAEAAFAKVVARHPDNHEARQMLARVRGFMADAPAAETAPQAATR